MFVGRHGKNAFSDQHSAVSQSPIADPGDVDDAKAGREHKPPTRYMIDVSRHLNTDPHSCHQAHTRRGKSCS